MARLKINAWILLVTFGIQIIQPLTVFALTGGPSQPEVQSFTPVGVSDMVDLFSGDFKYNIPLLDVDGYPVNLAYTGGISMDQEASWVGLGWNINCGVINRNMRGVPDDFNGDPIKKSFNMKPNETYSANVSVSPEFFGEDKLKLGKSANVGLSLIANYNNYIGFNVTQGVSANVSLSGSHSTFLTAGLSLSNSKLDGLSVSPSLSFGVNSKKESKSNETTIGVKIGSSYNSRAGLTNLSVSSSIRRETKKVDDKGKKSNGFSEAGVSSSFDLGPVQFSPNMEMPRETRSVSGKFAFGIPFFGIFASLSIGGGYSIDKLIRRYDSKPSFGVLYASKGQKNWNAVLDFNREKDLPYTPGGKSIGFAASTPDVFSVAGHGVGGSYKLVRNDLGYYYDPYAYTNSSSSSVGIELGYQALNTHGGGNIALTKVNSKTGCWINGNALIKSQGFQNTKKEQLMEPVYFKEANDKTVDVDQDLIKATGGFKPVRVALEGSKFKTKNSKKLSDINGSTAAILPDEVINSGRIARPNSIRYVTVEKSSQLALEERFIPFPEAKGHHIAEISVIGEDGKTYYYGQPLYNKLQRDLTFSVGSKTYTGQSSIINTLSVMKGTIEYSDDIASKANEMGADNYFSETIMPAYAHSYLITAIVSPDYSDIDNIRGPSDADLGTYTRFDYEFIENYKWRTPYGKDEAFYNEGLKSNYQDDKASFTYGVKDLAYLTKIETKNHVAVFEISDERQDGLGVLDINGGADPNTKLRKLKTIKLFNKEDYRLNPLTAIPIKTIHFDYEYTLCAGIPNFDGASSSSGKLTLKRIYFTYGNSQRGAASSYEFNYGTDNNYAYNSKAYDKWGTYKPQAVDYIPGVTGYDYLPDPEGYDYYVASPLGNSEFPYSVKNDSYASAWMLNEIRLPSGGTIRMKYESDEYAYVQDKKAMQMVTISGATNNLQNLTDCLNKNERTEVSLEIDSDDNPYFIFPLDGLDANELNKIHQNNYVYFRFQINIMKSESGRNHPEFVSGYGIVDQIGLTSVPNFGYIKFKPVKLQDSGSEMTSYIRKTAIQYGRVNMPRVVWKSEYDLSNSTGLSKAILTEILNSSPIINIVKGITDATTGMNKVLKNRDVGEKFIKNKSFIRLTNTNGHKPGGGYRVKSITLIDNWKEMADPNSNYSYSNLETGQEYYYDLEDGKSSGVATYEPQVGSDENPFRVPEFYDMKKILVPDDISYIEEPFGESFFPSPSVGYSRVIVKNIKPPNENITRRGSGFVESLFYTAKDYPLITKRTSPKEVPSERPFSLSSLGFSSTVKKHLVVSQGFYVETNDMHGKPKAMRVFSENNEVPIKQVQYLYKSKPYGELSRLDNECKVIRNDGRYVQAEIGVSYESNLDFRESVSTINAPSLGLNLDGFPLGIFPGITWMVWPGYVKEETIFRSVAMVKNVYKTGILEETIVTEEGSSISTKNLAYDAETGSVLLTETSNEFKDPLFNMKYPAYWHYKRMGPAYRNTGFTAAGLDFTDGIAPYANAKDYFVEGDQLFLTENGTNLGWVQEVRDNAIVVIHRDGTFVDGKYNVEVVKSGYKNQLVTEMQNMTTLSNPLDALANNNYVNVVNSSAIEYSNKWKTYCDCFSDVIQNIGYSSNPYVIGVLSDWRPWKSYTYLTDRNQAKYNDNSNIRYDGFYNTYTPFYKNSNGKWVIDMKNWTYTSEITEWHPYGAEIENRNALGIYSSSVYGYNQTLPLLVSGNARYNEVAFDGFEDYGLSPCSDDHFKFDDASSLTTKFAHTGRNSIKVPGSTTLSLQRSITALNDDCVQTKGCVMKLIPGVVDNSVTPSIIPVNVAGGMPPYNFQYNIVSGNAFVQFGLDQSSIYCRPDAGSVVTIMVTDAEGCAKSLQLNN
jgi:hypothetical protein